MYAVDGDVVYRVLVGSIGGDTERSVTRTAELRDAGQEVVPLGTYTQDPGTDLVVQAAIQEDVDVIDLAVDQEIREQVERYVADELAAYSAGDIMINTVRYSYRQRVRRWTDLDRVGPVNAGILAVGLDPDTATFKDIWNTLEQAYIARTGDPLTGKCAGRGQAKNIYTANLDRYGDHPTPGHQSNMSWWTKHGEDAD